MSDENTLSRRTILQAGTAVAAGGLLAGCLGDDEPPEPNDDDDDDDDLEDWEEFMEDANEYDGTIEDMTGQDEVEVLNGGGPAGLAYDPPAIEIDVGTTVVWEWTGEGGAHNVVAEDESFNSGDAVDEEGKRWDHTFDEEGTYTYYCTPHRAAGMKGVIFVE